MKNGFYIIAILSLLVSCTSTHSEPANKKEYIEDARNFYNQVEDNKSTINHKLWSDYKNMNDKIVGEYFLRFREDLVAREIVFIGNQNKKFKKYYSDYKERYNLVDESLKNDGDSIKIARKIKKYHENGQEDELTKYLEDAIALGGKTKVYPKAILFDLEIDDEYSYLWGEAW